VTIPTSSEKRLGATPSLAADTSNVGSLSELLFFELDGLVLVAGDAGADFGWCSAQFGLLVDEEALFGASGAFGAMQALKAAAQAGVAEGAVAAAIAGELIGDAADFRHLLVHVHLPGVTET
jgi:hypothetical protein